MIAIIPALILLAGAAACRVAIIKSKSNTALAAAIKWLQCGIN